MIIPPICVGVCKLHETLKICKGCYRSRLEIAQWHRASNNEKLEIMDSCETKKRIYGDINV